MQVVNDSLSDHSAFNKHLFSFVIMAWWWNFDVQYWVLSRPSEMEMEHRNCVLLNKS